uniref:Uncharacterized protein n=1 Tax=Eutreptiella gymnastica TaxID=73025 RepID=A0A7S1J3F1_9EUGL
MADLFRDLDHTGQHADAGLPRASVTQVIGKGVHSMATTVNRPNNLSTSTKACSSNATIMKTIQGAGHLQPTESERSCFDTLDESPKSPSLVDKDSLFQSGLDRNTNYKRTALTDELDFILEGTHPHVCTEQRVDALLKLLEWLTSQRHVSHQLRVENKLHQVIQAACNFDVEDEQLCSHSLLVLLCVMKDPMNHHFISEDTGTWFAFLNVLKAKVLDCIAMSRSSSFSGSDIADNQSTTRGLKRRRSFMEGRSPTKQKAMDTTSNSQLSLFRRFVNMESLADAKAECLAFTGLTTILLSGNKIAHNAALDPEYALEQFRSNGSAWTASGRFAPWFVANNGCEAIRSIVEKALHYWQKSKPASNQRMLLKTLQFFELLTCSLAAPGQDNVSCVDDVIATGVVDTMVQALQQLVADRGASRSIATAADGSPILIRLLRIIINICACRLQQQQQQQCEKPVGVPLLNTISLLEASYGCLVHECGQTESDMDIVNCCLCLLINMAEGKVPTRQQVSELQLDGVGIIPFLVREFESRLSKETAADNVVASYIAQLLGCLAVGHNYNRKCIQAELERYADRDEAVSPTDPNHGNPMVKLVAVLQEFLMFQSDAKVLTHSTLVGLHWVLTGLIEENHIVLPESPAESDEKCSLTPPY